ncbi:MAG TPA: T9SS type A sorting domain-containing protein [Bacteroidia bacterium]|jgi:hypothetical protein|nr:T9SS type A sorting domain-containing protein [Bacteroidia bacterium]
MKNKVLLYIALTVLSVFGYSAIQAQYYMSMGLAPGNPGGINKDSDVYFATVAPPSGSTVLYTYPYAKSYSLQYSATQTIPFTFNFNGSPVTQYKVASSGYITFTTASTTPVGPPSAALPSASLPDNSICGAWGVAGAADGGQIYTKLYGTAPNRQLWIVFWFAGNPSDTNSQNVWAIALEETTNNIYIVDEWGDIGNAAGVYNAPHLTVGVQVNSTTAYQVAASPNVVSHSWGNATSDNIYYEFSPSAATAYTPAVKMPLFEEFNQASCDPCAEATPNLDSALFNNKNTCSAVRYHVSWPGQDFMNQVTNTPFVNARVSYYTVSGVPDAKLDGSMDIYPGGIRSIELQDEIYIGSPFTISISSATYNPSTDVYSANATITAEHVMPAGLVAQAALTVDTITYAKSQTTETIPQTVFPQVAEDMMPSSSGTSLAAFTTVGATQTLTLSWTKNHPWGASPQTWTYDSNKNAAHLTIFIQDNTSKYVYQSANTLFTNVVTGINELSDVNYFNIYPNPTSNNATIAFNLEQSKNVNIEVYNMLGEKVYSELQGTMAAGQHEVIINSKALRSGIYFVRFMTDDGAITKKLIVQ